MTNYLDWSSSGKANVWRYLAAIILVLFLWFLLPIPMYMAFAGADRSGNLGDLLKEYSFLPAFIALPLVVRWVLKRPGWSVAMPVWPPQLPSYFWGILLGFGVIIASTLIASLLIDVRFQGFAPLMSAGVGFIALSLIGLAFQTAFEELLFRGLLMQFTYHLSGSVLLAILIQALLFGAIHIGNVAAFDASIWAMTPYTITALAWGWIAWRTGSLLIPAGLHFANNFGDVLLVGTEGDIIGTIAPWVTSMPSLSTISLLSAASALITLLAIEVLMRLRNTQATEAA